MCHSSDFASAVVICEPPLTAPCICGTMGSPLDILSSSSSLLPSSIEEGTGQNPADTDPVFIGGGGRLFCVPALGFDRPYDS